MLKVHIVATSANKQQSLTLLGYCIVKQCKSSQRKINRKMKKKTKEYCFNSTK